LAGNDLSKVTPEDLAILENKDAIAIDQDPLARQGDRVSAVGPYEVWNKPLSHGRQAIALFNRADLSHSMTVDLTELGVAANAHLRDVWASRETISSGSFTATVPKHGVVLLLVTR
jgi:alpha-galactosidase